MRPTIRAFEDHDRDAVIALSLRAWAPVFASLESVLGESGVYSRLHPDWHADQRRAVEETCLAEQAHVWIAEIDSVVGGFVAVRLDHETRMGEIHMLAVDPGHQRRGLGSLMTSFALEWMAGNGMTVAMVETGGDPGHAPARRTYEQAGLVRLPIARYFTTLR